jgi:hypothetical protein
MCPSPPSRPLQAAFRPYWPALIFAAAHTGLVIRPMRVAPLVALILPTFLIGCGTALESTFTVFADPGKYEWTSCEQLLSQRKYWENKAKELKQLMDRARQGTGGAAISVVAYQTDYVTAQEELKVLDMTLRVKKCKTDWQSDSVIR